MSVPRRALIVIDAQQEYFDGLLAIQYPPRDESIARIDGAIEAAVREGVPVVLVRHEEAADAPVFAAGSPTAENHPAVAAHEPRADLLLRKRHSSVFTETGLADWLRERGIDTVTLVGYMSNNCVLASAVDAEPRGLSVEVLSDATGAIDLANDAGRASARQVHETLMALLNSNWAAVADTATWIAAVGAGTPLPSSNLIDSALDGRAATDS